MRGTRGNLFLWRPFARPEGRRPVVTSLVASMPSPEQLAPSSGPREQEAQSPPQWLETSGGLRSRSSRGPQDTGPGGFEASGDERPQTPHLPLRSCWVEAAGMGSAQSFSAVPCGAAIHRHVSPPPPCLHGLESQIPWIARRLWGETCR